MKINEIRDNKSARRARKRRGRGIGSGLGKPGGRGHKGQKSRSGVALANFEGGQMPIYRRLPMRGFRNPSRRDFVVVNLGRLQEAVDAGRLDAAAPVAGAVLKAAGVVRRPRDGVRLLARGELRTPLHITVAGASRAAVAAVEKAGGSVTLSAGAGRTAADGSEG